MIFPALSLETTLQVDDKTRLNASKSFVTNNETITNIEIEPEIGVGFISVFNTNPDKWFLDWAYELDGSKVVSVRVTTNLGDRIKTYDTDVLTKEVDALFSNDNDLYAYEPNLAKYLPLGKREPLII